jgi:hypothetical protein
LYTWDIRGIPSRKTLVYVGVVVKCESDLF